MPCFLLASGSPRRRELFALLGLPFTVASADVDESPQDGEAPALMVKRLAQAKALAAAHSVLAANVAFIAAADTIVSLDGVALGKPANVQDAQSMLRTLRGRVHQVHTAIVLLEARTGRMLSDLATDDVLMRHYGDDEIVAYVAAGDPLDKAGAYAIQHTSFHPVAEMHGCFANVMGLPLCHLTRMLRVLHIEPPADVPAACQSHVRYTCHVFADILGVKRDT